MSEMHYDAVGIGELDLKLGDAFFNALAAKKLCLLDVRADAPKTTIPYVVKKIDGIRVGIISFGGLKTNSDESDMQQRKALFASYMAVRKDSDVLVVLDQSNTINEEWLQRNGERMGAPDIVISGIAKSGLLQPQVIGKTYIMPCSMQAKHVGVVNIEYLAGQDLKITCNKINLDESVPEDPDVAKRVAEVMLKSKQALVGSQPATISNVVSSPTTAATPSKPYYSPQLCKTCHAKEYEDWSHSKHASAIQTLVEADRTIPECLTCHSEMYRTVQRVTVPSNKVGGVECASCHSVALPHGMERSNAPVKTKVDTQVCMGCHNKEWSPNFDAKTYMLKIAHSGTTAKSGK